MVLRKRKKELVENGDQLGLLVCLEEVEKEDKRRGKKDGTVERIKLGVGEMERRKKRIFIIIKKSIFLAIVSYYFI